MSVDWYALTDLGFSVFPVPLREKRPTISWKSFQERRPTIDELTLWSESASNAAIATGAISGIIVLDTDCESAEAEVRRRGIPETPTVTTKKGRHHYFKHPGFPVRNFSGRIEGCDLRGDGGYVIAPGSVHASGAIYAWETSPDGVPFADPPCWLIELIRQPERASPPPPTTNATAYAEKALDNELASVRRCPLGSRNDTLNRAAFNLGQLVGAGALDEKHVETHLLATALAVGLPDGEATATIGSGLAGGKATPRVIPERANQRQGHRVRQTEAAPVVHINDRRRRGSPEVSPLTAIDPITWYQQDIPERRWLVNEWIPDHAVTGFYGDGGVGKSLCTMQLLTACAVGASWLGQETKPCKAVGFFCEDSEDELHRRQAAINSYYDIDMCDLEKLLLFSRVAEENALMTFDAAGMGQPTQLFNSLTAAAIEFGAQLVVIDTAADTFAGNENIRNQVRQFVTCLTKLAMEIDGAVVLCAHPSVSGIASGSGFAGSTAWNASVRSRLYLTRPDAEDGAVGPEERHLTRKKANYATTGDVISMRWMNGVLVHQNELARENNTITGDKAERAFLDCLDTLKHQGRYVTDSKNSPERYAPKVMAKMRQSVGISSAGLTKAMERLFAAGAIRVVSRGPKSRNSTEIVRS